MEACDGEERGRENDESTVCEDGPPSGSNARMRCGWGDLTNVDAGPTFNVNVYIITRHIFIYYYIHIFIYARNEARAWSAPREVYPRK